jgi:hypothetical protein
MMNRRTLSAIFVAVFAVALVVAVSYAYYAYQMPTERTVTTTLATYTQRGTWQYQALLENNTFYNRTILMPGDGKLYEPILISVNASYGYSFTSSVAPTNLSNESVVSVRFQTSRWEKTLMAWEMEEWLSLDAQDENLNMYLNISLIRDLFKTIDTETGSASSEFNITITPVIFQRANIQGNNVTSVFSPELVIGFRQDAGRYVDLSPTVSTKQGSITTQEVVKIAEVESLRLMAVAAAVASLVGLLVALYLFFRSKPTFKADGADKIIAGIKDMMIGTNVVPEAKTVVDTGSIDDLVKTAEILARPIMHVKTPSEHVFFILDGETKYQFKTSN